MIEPCQNRPKRICHKEANRILRLLAEWLIEQQVEEIVTEPTAQYWKPAWGALLGTDLPSTGRCAGPLSEHYVWARLVE